MFTKVRFQKKCILLTALLSFFNGSSLCLATESSEEDMRWIKYSVQSLPNTLNIIVLGPPHNGKSTLINILTHTSEYATRASSGFVLRDFEDRTKPIYHRDIFRFDVSNAVNPRAFRGAYLPDEMKGIPSISAFMPILGPIPVNDFLKEESLISFDEDLEASAEKLDGGTDQPHAYKSRRKVSKPVFRSTFIDAQGIGKTNRLEFFNTVLEKSPSDTINAFLLVVSAEQLASEEFTAENFEYFKEVAELLNQFDPTYTRVLLAVTHAANEDFLSSFSTKDNSRRVASVAFKKATGMVVSTSNIFFFENRYNCLSPSAVDALYDCYAGGTPNNLDVQEAFFHRQKNYQLNVLESFNLLKTAAKIKPSLSRSEIREEAKLLKAKMEEIEKKTSNNDEL